MKKIKAILNNDVIVLNEIPPKAKIKASQITTYEGVKYFNPDKAVITPDVPARPSLYHDWNGSKWVFDAGQKDACERAEALAKNVFSKLKIRRAMRALGQEQVLDDAIAQNAEFARDWVDSDEGINLNDASVIQAIQAKNIDVDVI